MRLWKEASQLSPTVEAAKVTHLRILCLLPSALTFLPFDDVPLTTSMKVPFFVLVRKAHAIHSFFIYLNLLTGRFAWVLIVLIVRFLLVMNLSQLLINQSEPLCLLLLLLVIFVVNAEIRITVNTFSLQHELSRCIMAVDFVVTTTNLPDLSKTAFPTSRIPVRWKVTLVTLHHQPDAVSCDVVEAVLAHGAQPGEGVRHPKTPVWPHPSQTQHLIHQPVSVRQEGCIVGGAFGGEQVSVHRLRRLRLSF